MSFRNLISLCLFFRIFLLQAQLSPQEKILRDNHIKKIFIYTLQDSAGNKQLSSVHYLNDSGLTIRSILIKAGKDSSSMSMYKYDSLNRIISDKTEYDGKIYETSYLYPEPLIKIIIDRSNTKMTANTIKSKITNRGELQYEYAGDKLVRKLKSIKKRYGYKMVYKTVSEKGHRYRIDTKGKEYLNADKNMVRSVIKYKGLKHTSKYITVYQYNSLKLRSKLIQQPVKDYYKRNYHQLGREYSCIVYEYFK